MKGIYCLLIHLPEEQEITVGSRHNIPFPRGYYAYTGSALGGLNPRINRHLRKDKKLHWHIDYLLDKAIINDIIIAETEDRMECVLAQALLLRFEAIPGFGASDCRCRSHLVFSTIEMNDEIMAVFGQIGVTPLLLPDLDTRVLKV